MTITALRSRRPRPPDAPGGHSNADLAVRLERIEAALAELLQTARERRLLHAIATATKRTTFSVSELLAYADQSPQLSAELCGWSFKQVGRLLSRSVGLAGAIEVRRIGDENGAALWVCVQKARSPVDETIALCDGIGTDNTDD